MYIIIGASGYLGTYLIKNILEKTGENILAVARHPLYIMTDNTRVVWVQCDIADSESVVGFCKTYLKQHNVSHKLIYLAAYHHPDMVEKNPRLAWDVNVTSLSRFLNLAESVDKLFYPSSDSVYGESSDGHRFKENDMLAPVNRYGLHKCCAERLVTAYGYNVVRFPFLIGPSLVTGRMHFYDTIVSTITSGHSIDMFCDSYRSALDFDTAAKLLIRTMEKPSAEVPEIMNICGDEALSKYEIGIAIADKVGAPRDLIRPVSINSDTSIFSVKRASSTLMDNTLMKHVLGLDEVKIDITAGNWVKPT